MINYGRFANPMAMPPRELNVLDRHGGFTIESKPPYWYAGERFDLDHRRRAIRFASGKNEALRNLIGDTLWRPGRILKKSTVGKLVDHDSRAFYQTNNDATLAVYRVPGYGYPVLAWFDNKTGERLA